MPAVKARHGEAGGSGGQGPQTLRDNIKTSLGDHLPQHLLPKGGGGGQINSKIWYIGILLMGT